MKSPFLLLPGLMCDQTVWLEQITALSDLADPIVVAEYGMLNSLPAMASHVLKSAPEKFAVAGHSMGGRVAMEVFRQAPDRVTHICLMDTRHHPLPAGEAGEKERAGRMHLLDIARKHGTRIMGEEWIKGMIHPYRLANDPVLVNTILDMFARKSADVFEAQQTALLNRLDGGPVMRRIQCPALILCGREDGWSSPPWHEAMAREIGSNATLTIVENSGHMSTMEQPAMVSAALREWIVRPN